MQSLTLIGIDPGKDNVHVLGQAICPAKLDNFLDST
jgi:hypothetical protein